MGMGMRLAYVFDRSVAAANLQRMPTAGSRNAGEAGGQKILNTPGRVLMRAGSH